jgi:hypothetical protein
VTALPTEAKPPPVPHPAGVVDLSSYRGRSAGLPAVVPPPRLDEEPLFRREPSPATGVLDGEVVIRRVRLGPVIRMTFGFSLCTFAVVLGAGVLVWQAISNLGVVANLESFVEDLGWQDVHLEGATMLRSASISGAILVVTATFLSGIFTQVFNLLSTLTGGVRAEVGPPPERWRDRRRAAKAEKRSARAAAKAEKAAKATG